MHVFYTVCIVTVIQRSTATASPSRAACPSSVARQALPQGRHHRPGRDSSVGYDPRAILHLLPDDVRGDHAIPDRRRLCGAHEVLRGCLVHSAGVTLITSRSPTDWAGPDAIQDAAKVLAAATDEAAKKVAQEKLDAVLADAGQVFIWGAIDFAGGTVVHINAGIAGLVGALLVGRRTGYGKELMPPHSLTMTMIGASLLWVGWFGFNAGSNLEANGGATRDDQFLRRHPRRALSWMFPRMDDQGQVVTPSARSSGCVAGLVAVPLGRRPSPAPWARSIVLGWSSARCVCSSALRSRTRSAMTTRARRVRRTCIGGIVGAIGTGILVNPMLGGAGIIDYTCDPAEGRRLRLHGAAHLAVQGVATAAGVVGRRLADHLQGGRRAGRLRAQSREARRPRYHRSRRAGLHDVRDKVRRRPGTAPPSRALARARALTFGANGYGGRDNNVR